ncbi:Tyrosine-protein kinase sid-3 [Frankliniella fusca]|uniref:Tyrosine-protein kinase sid-3 n=1 Tax=Frankliniella fusca TaxID=407009 RepID=A0AAE1HRA6_9NEOP|nr:Tyrosine-protein kinase sid-3 [Frankliniella fusca]
MFKSLLLVFAVLAVASAQYIASPYYSAGYSTYGGLYRSAAAYPAYSAYSTYGAYPYAYSGLGYGSAYLYHWLFTLDDF